MRVLTVNPGSSSVKLAVVEDGVELSATTIDSTSVESVRGPLDDLVARWQPVHAVGVRFVHGGDRAEAVVLDRAEVARLEALIPLAPLHQPQSVALAAMAAAVVVGYVVGVEADQVVHPIAARHVLLRLRHALPVITWIGQRASNDYRATHPSSEAAAVEFARQSWPGGRLFIFDMRLVPSGPVSAAGCPRCGAGRL
jgi:hypothetical protein